MAKIKRWQMPRPSGNHCITVFSANRLVMEGVETVRLCTDEKIVLRGKLPLSVEGEGLNLVQLGNDNMEINGRLKKLCFAEEF